MRFAIAAAVIAATPALAQDFDDSYERAMIASDACESAWFDRGRKAAMDELMGAWRDMVLANNPLSRDFDRNIERLDRVDAAAKRCTALVYPDS